MVLEEVIFDRQNNEFSPEDSDYFWFSVLKKIYKYSYDKAKVESQQKAYMALASFLEESLYQGCEQYGQIARTARLFLAVDEGDSATVQRILDEFKKKFHFQTYMRAIPGEIFPIGSYDKDPVLVIPLPLLSVEEI